MLTNLETKTLRVINVLVSQCDEGFSDIEIGFVEKITQIDAKVLRGVISSLSKKGLIQIEEQDVNGVDKQFYYTTDAGLSAIPVTL